MSSRYEEIMKAKSYLPLNMGYLTEAMVAKAEKELGETEEVKAKTIPELRKLVKAETKLFCPTDDAYLLQFLRTQKFDVLKAFSLLKNYYDLKKDYDDVYSIYDPESLKRGLELKCVMCLPYRDEDGCAIIVVKANKWDPDVSSVSEAIPILTINFQKCVHDAASQVCGIRVLIDVQGAYLKQIRCFTPRYIRLIASGLRNCFPIRLKGIHLYRESVIFHHAWSILRLFMTEKIKNRIHLHGDDQNNLHKFIPKAILPAEEYGGDNPNDVAAWSNGEVTKFFERYRELTIHGYRK